MNTLPQEDTPIRVLLVDDHRTMLWGLQKLIETDRRMQVAGTACTAAEMFDMVARVRPDVVLLDLDLGGHDATGDLPKLLQVTPARVLVLTATHDDAAHEAAILAGARGVVCKEEPPETILRAIERVHAGEVWIKRSLVGRVVLKLASPQNGHASDPDTERIARLTGREREIVATVVRQRGAKGIALAEQLNMSESTLRNRLSVIYDKLGVRNRIELVIYAAEHGLAALPASGNGRVP